MNDIRIWRSINTRFGHWSPTADELKEDETITANKAYTDEELKKISDSGFNAIWVHGMLRHIVKSKVFPEFGKHSDKHIKNMKELIGRAKKHNLKVFLYMQPPRGIFAKDEFWKNNMDVAGNSELLKNDIGKTTKCISLCTSTKKVKDYLKGSAAELVKQLPDLGGVILITASEYPSHCWGRGGFMIDGTGYQIKRPINCPLCAKRDPVEIVKEVICNIRDGIRSASEKTEIIAWNWSWAAYDRDPSPRIIKNLPKDVIFMAGFERGGKKKILEKTRAMDEYSLSYPGPSPRFKKSSEFARKNGNRIMTKLQIGTTHELATVPNLPLIGNLYDKAKYINESKLSGFMGCWNFGNMISANTTAFNYFLSKKKLKSKKLELKEFAESYFPGCDKALATEAWLKFSEAMDYYPFCIPFLYVSPVNYSMAYLIKPSQTNKKPCGRSWLMDKRNGDALDDCFGDYTLDEIIKGLGSLQKEWKKGAVTLEKALKNSKGKNEELSNAWCCYHAFRSAWNTFRAYKLRQKWSDAKLPGYIRIARNELENLESALPVAEKDKRLGFHGEAFGYMFNAKLIAKKISALKRQIRKHS